MDFKVKQVNLTIHPNRSHKLVSSNFNSITEVVNGGQQANLFYPSNSNNQQVDAVSGSPHIEDYITDSEQENEQSVVTNEEQVYTPA